MGKTADVTVDQMIRRRVWHIVLYQRVECEKESVVEKGALATGMATVVVRSSRKYNS